MTICAHPGSHIMTDHCLHMCHWGELALFREVNKSLGSEGGIKDVRYKEDEMKKAT